MTAADETLVARRAGAMCIAAGRHGDAGEWPCDRHLALARWLLGVPSSAVAPAVPPHHTDHRPGTLNPRAAYRPNDLGQKQV